MPRQSAGKVAPAPQVQLQEHIRKSLEDDILDGRVLPGERLDEQMIGERFGVSRTPAREALLQLASLGLVQFKPRHGAIVARLTLKQIFAMWEFLVGLEGLCAEFASRRMTIDERDTLVKLHEQSNVLAEQNDVKGYDAVNTAIHEAIYRGSKNQYLEQNVLDIRRRLRIYRRYPFERAGGIRISHQGHAAVVEAIARGDDHAAGKAMRDHVNTGGQAFHDFIAEMPEGLLEDDQSRG